MGNVTEPFVTTKENEPDKVIPFAFSAFLGNAALEITNGLLSALPGVGSVIVTALKLVVDSVSFEPDENEALLKEFEKILHKELASNEVNVATGKLAHVQRWLKNDYEPAVQSGHDRRKLHTMLEEKVKFLQEDVFSIVYEQKQFEEIGLKTFITAGAVHLAMLQEMAVRDPDQDRPEASRHAISITRYAPEYAQHAVRVAKKLVKDRRNQVKFENKSKALPSAMAAYAIIEFQWKDEVTGQVNGRRCSFMSGSGRGPEDQAGNEAMVKRWCKERKDKVAAQLLSDLGQPLAVASKWRELEERPIN